MGQYEVRYAGFKPEVYFHQLLPSEYGKNWLLVA